MTAPDPAPDTAEALAEVLARWFCARNDDCPEADGIEGYSCDHGFGYRDARALLDSGVLDAVKAEGLREAADDFAVIPHPYEGGVTSWLRHRANTLARPVGPAPDNGGGGGR